MSHNSITAIGSALGRFMIATIFLMSAVGNKIPNFEKTTQYMAGEGIPAPQLLLVGAIAFLIAGSVSVILGYFTRFGAGLLFVFLVLATYFFHDFWTFEDAAEKQQQMIQFMKNLSLLGTMLFLIVNGPGQASLDNMSRRRLSAET